MSIKKFALITTLVSAFFLTGCDNNKQSVATDNKPADKTQSSTLKVGVISGPEQEVAEVAKQQAKDLYNLDIELVIFNDYVTPNQALNDGLIDINAFQHKPYLDEQIKERGYKLSIVGNSFVYPIASYSKKLKPITQSEETGEGVKVTSPRGETFFIAANSTIAIPNDPTNLGRALLLLQHEGMITVDKAKGLLPTVLDITSNPYNYKIIELEAPMLPRSLDDAQVDLAIINNAFAGQVNLTPSKDGIFVEDKDSPYVNIIVAHENNKDDENVKNFVKSYQTEAVAEKANQIFNGGAIRGW
ncbi:MULTISPECIES: methionine ABC transporter substrate-binding lipoprotein MetQ [unclassified Gilliamella]|uniref:methionine ABC transporter substrate-binding lipoprotein MetQ n=1 Tax=unclassified Gilliamella TaxID=2685620 RepID=UPI00080E99C9|nr:MULTISPECIES: methionine ABC transporter substrate-binding lipoprotein MetQ [Gilliamella]MWP50149.1 MetQ/NlpA family lipoprotein [Gilliamella sp. Lep-s35]MWP69861.1 MetQ/NlpA family lipoprotein [Gilliamella sp. Lep-s5]MWP78172.1 MetQ/NlpA family lipoprotein [Gilliamella sp. Lep-s21]OCG45660.1 DL-methionine transporter substrate-binding subunit [Gilliamella apicola]